MKGWQNIILQHHSEAKIINDNQIMISDIGYNINNHESYSHIITRDSETNKFLIEEYIEPLKKIVNKQVEDDLYNYLGY